MRKLCVIGWRPLGRQPWYFRGDQRREIYLPKITEELISQGSVPGWFEELHLARVFEMPIVLEDKSFHRDIDRSRFWIYDYDGQILPTQVFRRIERPRWR